MMSAMTIGSVAIIVHNGIGCSRMHLHAGVRGARVGGVDGSIFSVCDDDDGAMELACWGIILWI